NSTLLQTKFACATPACRDFWTSWCCETCNSSNPAWTSRCAVTPTKSRWKFLSGAGTSRFRPCSAELPILPDASLENLEPAHMPGQVRSLRVEWRIGRQLDYGAIACEPWRQRTNGKKHVSKHQDPLQLPAARQ